MSLVTIGQALDVPLMTQCNSLVLDSGPTDTDTDTRAQDTLLLSSVTV